ncbi:glycerate kinase [Kroppenstedtia eburnea]|uniref:Glycerate kinase n=1 Tax=Kroppenstedtia eburnea TaxID=714067 RepID=A0A1N7MJM0_9BACL|nr:glycerate kinase [Kroppenstedtia eburnea]
MNVVIAPDSFKGSMSSREAAERVRAGVARVFPVWETTVVPMADGGEGTVEAILAVIGGRRMTARVKDPLGRSIEAEWGYCEKRGLAVIETAAASGLALLKEPDPARASTYGTGQLLKQALDHGVREVVIGLGGSATVDAGTGFFAALGVRFYDGQGELLEPAGGNLGEIDRIDGSGLDPRLQKVRITIASDVTHPLLGPEGAIHVFGPQKGIQAEELDRFEEGMGRFAERLVRVTGRDHRWTPGSGAAGGFGFSLLSLLNVEWGSGLDLIAAWGHLEEKIRQADLVITGEGRMDRQSLYGKVPVGIARIAARHEIPVVAFTGQIQGDLTEAEETGISVILPITEGPISLEDAMRQGPDLLERAACRFAQVWRLGESRGVKR